MAKTDWTLDDEVQPTDMNDIGEEINQLRTDLDNIDIPLASLTQAGIVQLSNATDSTDEDKAATPKAVKTVEDDLNSHASLFSAHGATSSATASRIIMRDSAGRAKIAAPSASDDIARKDTVDNAVGNLSNLMTSAKSNAVAAINELFTSASNGKSQIAAAITGKGVPASGSDTFSQLATKIGQIDVGKKFASGTSTQNTIGQYKQFVQANGTTTSSPYVSISGLSFIPSLILVFLLNHESWSIYSKNVIYNKSRPDVRMAVQSGDGAPFYTNAFRTAELSGPTYDIPVTIGTASLTFNWFAFE